MSPIINLPRVVALLFNNGWPETHLFVSVLVLLLLEIKGKFEDEFVERVAPCAPLVASSFPARTE
ncbi:MAG: hypothetical protein MUF81_18415 [Verrucomicrobia bacterium]|nr:hypothetical protein [Verrucomicrobiota bacterium]